MKARCSPRFIGREKGGTPAYWACSHSRLLPCR
jgi:hypothetical protein